MRPFPWPSSEMVRRLAGAADTTDTMCAGAAVSPPPLPTMSSPASCGPGSPQVATLGLLLLTQHVLQLSVSLREPVCWEIAACPFRAPV